MNTVKDNLIAAKALIDTPEKWGKGWPTPEGTLCIYMATSSLDDDYNAEEALRIECSKIAGHDLLSHFNDAPSTTHADIMALFDRAIAAHDGA